MPQSTATCPHERRPGTTVCLRCRHAARLEARERLKQAVLRGSAVAVVVVTFIVAGAVGASAILNRLSSGDDASASTAAGPGARRVASVTSAAGETAPDSAGALVSPAAPRPSAPSSSARPLAPVLPAGKTALHDGITAVRADSEVVVAFDTPEARTRRPEKFERFVRATLPLVYGEAAGEVLARLPDGAIADQGALLTELPSRGVRIPVDTAWTIRLFPETRPGQDGPLVIRYRVLVAHN